MKRAEYWLLDTVVEHPYPVDWLGAKPKDLEMMFNRDHHGLTDTEVVQTLYRLCQRGDLGVYPDDWEDSNAWKPLLVMPMLTDLEAALHGTLQLYYALTPQGAKRWEALSAPQWNRYLTGQGWPDEDSEQIMSADKRVLDEYLALYPYINSEVDIIPTSIIHDIEEPWQATYWKTLPRGHGIRFRYTWKEEDTNPSWKTTEARIHAQAQWSALQRWYTPYHGE